MDRDEEEDTEERVAKKQKKGDVTEIFALKKVFHPCGIIYILGEATDSYLLGVQKCSSLSVVPHIISHNQLDLEWELTLPDINKIPFDTLTVNGQS